MSTFIPSKKSASDFNSGNKYNKNNGVTHTAFNNLVEGLLFAQENGGSGESSKIDFWSESIAYKVGDIVQYGFNFYRCAQANTGYSPTNTQYWSFAWSGLATGVYKGEYTFENKPSASATNDNCIFMITNKFTTDIGFIGGAGQEIPANALVKIIYDNSIDGYKYLILNANSGGGSSGNAQTPITKWVSGTYKLGDVVSKTNALYRCKVATTTEEPSILANDWETLVRDTDVKLAYGGEKTFEELYSPDVFYHNYVFTVTNSFTTTDWFIGQVGRKIPKNALVVIVTVSINKYKYLILNEPLESSSSGGGIVPVEALPTANKEEYDKHLLYLYKKDLHFVSTKAGDNYVATLLPSTGEQIDAYITLALQYKGKMYGLGHPQSATSSYKSSWIFDGNTWSKFSTIMQAQHGAYVYDKKREKILIIYADDYAEGVDTKKVYSFDGNSVSSIYSLNTSYGTDYVWATGIINDFMYVFMKEYRTDSVTALKINLGSSVVERIQLSNKNDLAFAGQYITINNVLYVFGSNADRRGVWKFDGTTLTKLSVTAPINIPSNTQQHSYKVWSNGTKIYLFNVDESNHTTLIFDIATQTFTSVIEPNMTGYNIADMGDYCISAKTSTTSYAYKAGETYTFKKILSENE